MAAAALAVLLFALLLLSDQLRWNRALENRTANAFLDYLGPPPVLLHRSEAIAKLEPALIEECSNLREGESFSTYLRRARPTALHPVIRQCLEYNELLLTARDGTLAAYEDYLGRYPQGTFDSFAKLARDWQAKQSSATNRTVWLEVSPQKQVEEWEAAREKLAALLKRVITCAGWRMVQEQDRSAAAVIVSVTLQVEALAGYYSPGGKRYEGASVSGLMRVESRANSREAKFAARLGPPSSLVWTRPSSGTIKDELSARMQPSAAPFTSALESAGVLFHLVRLMTEVAGPSFPLLVIECLDYPPTADYAAAKALEAYAPASLELFLHALVRSDRLERLAGDVLQRRGESMASKAADLVRLDSVSSAARHRVAAFLWESPSPLAQEALAVLLRVGSVEQRTLVLSAVRVPKAPGAFEMCARLARDPEVATAAIGSLARFSDPRAVPLLQGIAADHSNPLHRTALEALGSSSLADAAEVLMDFWVTLALPHDATCKAAAERALSSHVLNSEESASVVRARLPRIQGDERGLAEKWLREREKDKAAFPAYAPYR